MLDLIERIVKVLFLKLKERRYKKKIIWCDISV